MVNKRTIRRKKKIIKSVVINMLILILIVLSLALIFNSSIRNIIIAWNTNKYQVNKISKKNIDNNKSIHTTFDFEQVEPLSIEGVIQSQWNAQKLPVIGGIAIPDLSLNLPIFKGLNNSALCYGAGTMKETQEMGKGNYPLASHHVFGVIGSSKMLFSPLEQSKEGMKIYLTDKANVYTYVTTTIDSVSPKQVGVIDDRDGIIEVTLITCEDAEATSRTVVKGQLESITPYGQIPKDVLKAFSKSYNHMEL